MTENRPSISRRRVIGGAGVGAAAIWAAPAVTTLGGAAFAAGSPNCSDLVFQMDLTGVPDGTYAAPGAVGNMFVVIGDVNRVGTGIYSSLTPGLDLLGEAATGITQIRSGTPVAVGGTYQVSATLKGSERGDPDGDNSATVSLGSGSSSLSLASAAAAQTITFLATAAAGDYVVVDHTSSPDNIGMLLLDLKVFACTV